jgi:hypothetical protein
VSRGNHEEKGSKATVQPTQLSGGCAVSVVVGGGKILGNVTNVASRAAHAVVGGAAVVGARQGFGRPRLFLSSGFGRPRYRPRLFLG